ncbi:hypothetical protein RintRC_6268 [Richelia intracellularis]|nr:hypothetical protein RintRC_6268 [Richelia intracellularis]
MRDVFVASIKEKSRFECSPLLISILKLPTPQSKLQISVLDKKIRGIKNAGITEFWSGNSLAQYGWGGS